MQFASYADFREKVRILIEGDEIGETFSTTTLDLIIGLAEQRIYRDLRASTMYTTATLTTVTNNALPLPTSLLALDRVSIGGDQVEVTDLWRVEQLINSGASASDPTYCTQKGDSLIFFPAVANSTSIVLSYYARPADLSAGINTTVTRYPEVFLYGSVAESAPFLGEDGRVGLWEQKYANALAQARTDERWRSYSGSPLRVRNR